MTQTLDSIVDSMEMLAGYLEDIIVPLLAIELIWLWRKKQLNRDRFKEMAANASSLILIIPAGIAGFILWMAFFESIERFLPYAITTNWISAVLCLLLVDLIYYAEHRFEHTHRLPWDLYHSVHHSSPKFDQTTSLRLSAFDAFLTMGFLIPAVLVGFNPFLVAASYAVVVGYQTWIHTEIVKKTPRWFEFIFNTASHHRVHHGADEVYLDTNYGGTLILWDRMFGTFQVETHRPTYGLTTQIESSKSDRRTVLRDSKALGRP